MRKMFSKLWKDDAGIVALEYLLVATIVGLGLVVGLGALSAGLNEELTALANAIMTLNQSYSISAQSTCVGGYTGSTFYGDSVHNVSYLNTSTSAGFTTAVSQTDLVGYCP